MGEASLSEPSLPDPDSFFFLATGEPESLLAGLADRRDAGLAEWRDAGLPEWRDAGVADLRDAGLPDLCDAGLPDAADLAEDGDGDLERAWLAERSDAGDFGLPEWTDGLPDPGDFGDDGDCVRDLGLPDLDRALPDAADFAEPAEGLLSEAADRSDAAGLAERAECALPERRDTWEWADSALPDRAEWLDFALPERAVRDVSDLVDDRRLVGDSESDGLGERLDCVPECSEPDGVRLRCDAGTLALSGDSDFREGELERLRDVADFCEASEPAGLGDRLGECSETEDARERADAGEAEPEAGLADRAELGDCDVASDRSVDLRTLAFGFVGELSFSESEAVLLRFLVDWYELLLEELALLSDSEPVSVTILENIC